MPGLKANDPRVVKLSALVKSLFPGRVFFLAIASPNEDEPIASIGNTSTEVQVMLLRALLKSFEMGTASTMRPVPVGAFPYPCGTCGGACTAASAVFVALLSGKTLGPFCSDKCADAAAK